MTNPTSPSTKILSALEEIDQRSEKATEGPWEYGYSEPYCAEIRAPKRELEGISVWLDDAPLPDFNAKVDCNAEFIASSRTDLPALSKALRRAVEGLESCRGRIHLLACSSQSGLVDECAICKHAAGRSEALIALDEIAKILSEEK